MALVISMSALSQNDRFESGVQVNDLGQVSRAYVLCKEDTTLVFARIFRGCTDGVVIDYYGNGRAESAFASVPGGQDKISLEWFNDGRLKSQRVDRGDGLKGYYKEWHSSGLLKISADLRNGKPDGQVLEWDEYGRLVRDERYRLGVLKRARIKGSKL